MAILLEVRPDAPEREQIRSLREQLEMYLNGAESITQEEIDMLLSNVKVKGSSGGGSHSGGGGGGGGGTDNYNELINKPQIEGITLVGDKSFEDLQLLALTNTEIEELLDND